MTDRTIAPLTSEDRAIFDRNPRGYDTWRWESFANQVQAGELRIAREDFGSVARFVTHCIKAAHATRGLSDTTFLIY